MYSVYSAVPVDWTRKYKDESKVLQYFDNIQHNLSVPNAFAKVKQVTNDTEL